VAGDGTVRLSTPRRGILGLMIHMANPLVTYLREAREELRKVSWPRWPETRNNTLLVVGISLFVAVFLGLLDLGLNFVLQLVLNR